ncbi:MAG: hypothetical protein MUF39_13120 [Cyclobacteriaceae bacterium]|nr:hypothetical protein [Cyclobacteriaceae bacterium]
MKRYKEFQFGWWLLAFFVPIYVAIFYMYVNQSGERPIPLSVLIIFSLLFSVIYILFYGMTTLIDEKEISICFGIGLIRKRIMLQNIVSVEEVKNPWYYGWGIRLIPNGMLYNIGGFKAVEIKLKDTTSSIRIGTRNSSRLLQQINNRLSH